jgi:hypothetical protein
VALEAALVCPLLRWNAELSLTHSSLALLASMAVVEEAVLLVVVFAPRALPSGWERPASPSACRSWTQSPAEM